MTNEVLGEFQDDLPFGHVMFVVAKRPVDTLELVIEGFEVDGRSVILNQTSELPASQGYWIDIGAFAVGKEIEVQWHFRTGIRVPEGDVVIGHCANGRLTRLVRLERRTLEPFKPYQGSFKVTPEAPFAKQR